MATQAENLQPIVKYSILEAFKGEMNSEMIFNYLH